MVESNSKNNVCVRNHITSVNKINASLMLHLSQDMLASMWINFLINWANFLIFKYKDQ